MSRGEAASIVKIQAPLNDPDPRAPALLYAEGRKGLGYIAMRNLPQHIRRALAKAPKVYAQATWNAADEGWDVGLIVGDRPW